MPTIKPKRREKRSQDGDSAQGRRRHCYFCRRKLEEVDYKDHAVLQRFVSERGRIRSRRVTGACRRHQLQVAVAVKRAREMALLHYVAR